MRAKKSLGQNFLKSDKAVLDIVGAAALSSSDIAVEIGPGKGILTEALLKNTERVVAVEKDDRLIGYLAEKFAGEIKSGKLILVHEDILDFRPLKYGLKNNSYKLIANIPYYITGLIMRKFLEDEIQPSKIILMVQKEVAERIVARSNKPFNSARGKESVLSISVKVFGRPKLVKKISASCFSPKPKVDSAILLIENISSPFRNTEEKGRFFKILKIGFAHKRKLLKRNLDVADEDLAACGIGNTARPEELSVQDWLCLERSETR